MPITRALVNCIRNLCIVMLGLTLLTKLVGTAIPHGQYIPIRVENKRQKFYAWSLLDLNRNTSVRIISQVASIGEYVFSSDGEHILLTSIAQPDDRCYWSAYSWVDHKIEQFPVSETCLPIEPRWSPDNRFIVFNREGDIYIFSLETGEVHLVYRNSYTNYNAVWSTDGKLLAFPARQTRDLKFLRMNCSENCQPVSDVFASLNYSPLRASWSPDQSHMAFLSTIFATSARLYVWDSACLTEEVPDCKLQKGQFREIVLNNAIIFGDHEPIWSSDGHYLMFGASINGRPGFYRVASDCYAHTNGCKFEMLLDFNKIIQNLQ